MVVVLCAWVSQSLHHRLVSDSLKSEMAPNRKRLHRPTVLDYLADLGNGFLVEPVSFKEQGLEPLALG